MKKTCNPSGAGCKGLGKIQNHFIKMLGGGWKIRIHRDFSKGKEDRVIVSANEAHFLDIPAPILKSFLTRGILLGTTIHTSVQPDTETIEYFINHKFVSNEQKDLHG